ncbi:MAG TPA: DNA repair protein RecO [Paracoccaceae bacterium]|nr:DNA repair protein RecO [Paracoccaceae bacterium]
MRWRDEGLLLSVRRHGEGAAILEVFTEGHGRHAGVAPGGGSRRQAPLLQPGAQLSLEWSARLEAHIGSWRAEPLRSRAAALMGDRAALAAMGSVAALSLAFLPERAPHPALYARTVALADALGEDPDWPALYALWELALLSELGFGLDLSVCAATGATEDLAWISPKSGRAVSREAGGPWADRLLPLPRLFLGEGEAPDVAAALRVTGHFLDARAAPAFGLERTPEARERLVRLIG